MTNDSGQIATYVDEVRAALGDLPAPERDDLLEDLPAHLSEVASEDPAPLRDRLGPPDAYAAELRAALHPAGAGGRRPAGVFRWRSRWEPLRGRLGELDVRAGRLLGYERVSEFGRLLVPAWWVLRGYLAAMVTIGVLDGSGNLGLLPRLGGNTLVGVVILAAFIAGSVWLARRTRDLNRWQRRAMGVATAFLVIFGLAGFAGLDANQRWGWPNANYVSGNPYDHVEDIFPVDEEGRLLTDVTLLDQNGSPVEIGYGWCDETDPTRYPHCPGNAPWWLPGPSEGAPAQE